jgi:hypothetical protein
MIGIRTHLRWIFKPFAIRDGNIGYSWPQKQIYWFLVSDCTPIHLPAKEASGAGQ